MIYNSEMCFLLQTPAFNKYLKLNRDGREKTQNYKILLRKINSYIFNLEPNLLKHSVASQMEVCTQGSLSRNVFLLHHSHKSTLKNDIGPLIHSEASVFHYHSAASFFSEVGTLMSLNTL